MSKDYPRRVVRRSRQGVAATEFAVCLPVMLLILMGMLEASTMIFLKQSLSVAAYEGIHTALVPEATAADVERAAQAVLTDRRVRNATVTVSPANLSRVPAGQFIEVRVTAPSDSNNVIPLRFFKGRTLQASASMMKES